MKLFKKLVLAILFAFGIMYVHGFPPRTTQAESVSGSICAIIRTVNIRGLSHTQDVTRKLFSQLFCLGEY